MIVRPSGVLLRAGRLLLMRYRYGALERFNLPGGKPDPEETLEACLVREFQEELGLTVAVGPLHTVAETLAGGRHVLHLLFSVTAEGEPRLNPDQTSALGVAWLTPEQLAGAALYPEVGRCLVDGHGHFAVPAGRFVGRVAQPWG